MIDVYATAGRAAGGARLPAGAKDREEVPVRRGTPHALGNVPSLADEGGGLAGVDILASEGWGLAGEELRQRGP